MRAKAKARFAQNPGEARARATTRKAQLRTEAAAKIAVAAESRQAEVQEPWGTSRSWSAGQNLPPAFACIQDQTCLAWVREMYGYFEQCSVKTCASCNERWFKVPTAPLSFGWKPQTSKMLSAPAGAHLSKMTTWTVATHCARLVRTLPPPKCFRLPTVLD